MDDNVAQIARAAARRFEVETEVEAALHSQADARYVDPIALGGLIVSIASLAWTIYTDLRDKGPSAEALARDIRLELGKTQTITPETREVIEVVVKETLDHAAGS